MQSSSARDTSYQSVNDLMFDGGQHPFKLLRLGGDHGRTQVGVACNGSVHKHKHLGGLEADGVSGSSVILTPIQLRLQLAVSSIGHYVLLAAALRGYAADVEHKVRPLHSGAIWRSCGATRLSKLTADFALLE